MSEGGSEVPKEHVVPLMSTTQKMQEKATVHAEELEDKKKGGANEHHLKDELVHDGLFVQYRQFLATKNIYSRGMQLLEKMSLKKCRKT